MVAYGFKKQFERPIFRGDKPQTIRRREKKRHAKVGEAMQLYFGLRTQYCRKILISDPICLAVIPCAFDVGPDGFESIEVDGRIVQHRAWKRFAKADGFPSIGDMHLFWKQARGVGDFDDYLMFKWSPPDVPNRPRLCPGGTGCQCCNVRCLCGCRLKCGIYHNQYIEYSKRRSARLRTLKKKRLAGAKCG